MYLQPYRIASVFPAEEETWLNECQTATEIKENTEARLRESRAPESGSRNLAQVFSCISELCHLRSLARIIAPLSEGQKGQKVAPPSFAAPH